MYRILGGVFGIFGGVILGFLAAISQPDLSTAIILMIVGGLGGAFAVGIWAGDRHERWEQGGQGKGVQGKSDTGREKKVKRITVPKTPKPGPD